MPCVYSSRMVKNYRICPIRIEIIHCCARYFAVLMEYFNSKGRFRFMVFDATFNNISVISRRSVLLVELIVKYEKQKQ